MFGFQIEMSNAINYQRQEGRSATHKLVHFIHIHTQTGTLYTHSHTNWYTIYSFTHKLVHYIPVHTQTGTLYTHSHTNWYTIYSFTHKNRYMHSFQTVRKCCLVLEHLTHLISMDCHFKSNSNPEDNCLHQHIVM
jgi:uncharacterized protein YbaR (Trm112 family)